MAVFVVHGGHVLLHPHPKLGIWLPPGGHIEPDELPDDAAVRETDEEAGISVHLIGETGPVWSDPEAPRPLVRPIGIQLETIMPGHEHIDLVYLAAPVDAIAGEWPDVLPPMRWVALDELDALNVTDEIAAWCRAVLTS